MTRRLFAKLRALPRQNSTKERPGRRLRIDSLEDRTAPAAFTAGDIVVVRVGDGSAAITSAATAVFLDEYTQSGAFVQSIAMPVTASGSNHILTMSGSAQSEGAISLSADGQYVTIGGYDAAVGTANVTSSSTG